MKYYKQLDSLRGIAVLLVLLAHYLSQQHVVNRLLPNGFIGVTLFFVLSGFLITGILLTKARTLYSIKNFYIRRSLRIFPAYYLLMIIAVILPSIHFFNEGGWWHLLYLSNFYFYIYNEFKGALGILWSLSVEEQFYLFWPALIIFTKQRNMILLFITGMILAFLFRLFITTETNYWGRFLLPGSLDSFCTGALIAYCFKTRNKIYYTFYKYRPFIIAVSCIIFTLIHIDPPQYHQGSGIVMGYYFLLLSLVLGVVVWLCADGIKFKPLQVVLENKLLLFIGKISYGIYLFQNLIPQDLGIMLPHSFSFFSIYIVMAIRLTILFMIASLSWYFIEKPILNLRPS